MLQPFRLHEICQTVSYVVKQLQRRENTGHWAKAWALTNLMTRPSPHFTEPLPQYLGAIASDNFIGCWVELTLHLDVSFPLLRDLYLQDTKFGPSKIQRKKFPIFY